MIHRLRDIHVLVAGATVVPIIPNIPGETDADSQMSSLWCGDAQAVHGTVQRIMMTIPASTVSAGSACNEYEAAAVEHHECQSQRAMLLAKFVQELYPLEEPRKKLQTIRAMMILAISWDLTRSVQRAPRQGLQVLG